MAIAANEACPKCREAGRDRTGDHLLVFEDGGRYCGRSHLHTCGKPYYAEGTGSYIETILSMQVDGSMKYTASQFRELFKAGKLKSPEVRACALSGMRQKDRWEVSTDEEKDIIMAAVQLDKEYFDNLPVRNLTSRGIRGDICRLFDVHVGLDSDNKVSRIYCPTHNTDLTWRGAVCRTLPKTFGLDNLGHNWGKTALFGMKVSAQNGGRRKKLLVVGGHMDAMAAYQMLSDQDKSGKYSYHVWSVVHGEAALDDLINNKEEIDKFEEIIWGFDNDPAGRKANIAASRLFRGKSKFLLYPAGCKDANSCLQEGQEAAFVDAWFHPVDSYGDSCVKRVSDFREALLQRPKAGLSWFAPDLNRLTFGIRENMLYVIGAGSGVGKTAFTKRVCFSLMEDHKVPVGVIYLEEPPLKTCQSYASYYTNGKRLDLPPNYLVDERDRVPECEYTDEEAMEAIDRLDAMDLLHVVDTGGDKSIEKLLSCIDDLVAQGVHHIVVDNLTAITHPKAGSKVDSIDESMKALGNYKDENPCTIFLLSHLKRLDESKRTTHNRGGEVREDDFRGSGSIVMWANYVFGLERDCFGTEFVRRTTTIRCLKDRDSIIGTGKTVKIFGQADGKLEQFDLADKSGITDTVGDESFDEF